MFVKIGRFITGTDIIVQDVIEDNLFVTVEKVLAILKSKYLKANISYKGIHRQEQLEYPENALREAVLNAVVHRDYTGVFTQIRVNNAGLDIWNAGQLPFGLNVEMLYGQHASIPRNRTLAGIFFRAGYIEAWGRGTVSIVEECKKNGLPVPVFTEEFGGFSVSFKKGSMHVTMQDAMQDTVQDTINDERVLTKMKELLAHFKGEMTREELQAKVNIKNRDYFRLAYIIPALENGLIEMMYPEKPRSKFQKYRLTPKGISVLSE